jgi:hypothetical protein
LLHSDPAVLAFSIMRIAAHPVQAALVGIANLKHSVRFLPCFIGIGITASLMNADPFSLLVL